MRHALSKNNFALFAALGLLFCLCYAIFQPAKPYVSAVLLPDDPDVRLIDQTIRNHDLSRIRMTANYDAPLELRWGTHNDNTWNFSLNGKFTKRHLQDALRALEYTEMQPADPSYESRWLETYQRPFTLMLYLSGDYVYLYSWKNCPEVWVVLLDYDPETQIYRWSDTVRYTFPETSNAYPLYDILETAERIYEGAGFISKTVGEYIMTAGSMS